MTSYPARGPLAAVGWPAPEPAEFTLTYVHSVTHTPVAEHYRIAGVAIVETEIRFAEHGPGLPTEADAGASFARRDGGYVVTMERRFGEIVMQVHVDQSPRLIAGTRTVDLAQWGNRALALGAVPGPCPGTPVR